MAPIYVYVHVLIHERSDRKPAKYVSEENRRIVELSMCQSSPESCFYHLFFNRTVIEMEVETCNNSSVQDVLLPLVAVGL
jgi:hypothetical protein